MDVNCLAEERAKINLEALHKCRKALGGAQGIADNLGLWRQTVSLWKEVPHAHVRQLAALCGVPPAEILPDPYPYPESGVINEEAKARKRRGPKPKARPEAGHP